MRLEVTSTAFSAEGLRPPPSKKKKKKKKKKKIVS